MDMKSLLVKKKKELALGINSTDPVVAAYKLGAYNLCDELLNVININNDKLDLKKEKVRWAIKEEPSSYGFNTITGDSDIIDKCIKFIDECYRDDKHILIINMAKHLFPELEWDYAFKDEYSYLELEIEYVYSSDGCHKIHYDYDE